MLSTESGRAYEVLGVKPGVSIRELKAAHRDLAKVWHPDRFFHDPRLQEKAQEKLKEINEAYEQLISGKTPPSRRDPTASTPSPTGRSREVDYTDLNPVAESRATRWGWVVLPLLVFMAVFSITSRVLLRQLRVQDQTRQAEQSGNRQQAYSVQPEMRDSRDSNNASRNREQGISGRGGEASSGDSREMGIVAPLPTVTVMIDPSTGLLATPNCPLRTRMTYPTGNEPHGYCNARHPVSKTAVSPETEQVKDSRIKSFAKRAGVPEKWLGTSKEKPDNEAKQER